MKMMCWVFPEQKYLLPVDTGPYSVVFTAHHSNAVTQEKIQFMYVRQPKWFSNIISASFNFFFSNSLIRH